MKVSWDYYSQDMEKMFQTTNQYRMVQLIFVAANPQALIYLHRCLLLVEVAGLHVVAKAVQA